MNLCQKIKPFYEELLAVRKELDSLFASGLKERDRKEYFRQGGDLQKRLEKKLTEWLKLKAEIEKETQSDKAIARKLEKIRKRLNIELCVSVINSCVYVEAQDELEMADVLRAIVEPDSPVKRLSFRNWFISMESLRALANALKNPNNKIVDLNLNSCRINLRGMEILREALTNQNNKLQKLHLFENGLGSRSVELIVEILKNPNCKLEYLNLLGNAFAVVYNEVILEAARKTGRQIVVELDYPVKR